MKIPTFFRFLNKKIEQYDKMATNPFTSPQPVILIWVEEYNQPKQSENHIKELDT